MQLNASGPTDRECVADVVGIYPGAAVHAGSTKVEFIRGDSSVNDPYSYALAAG
jgi:hypothetical protein